MIGGFFALSPIEGGMCATKALVCHLSDAITVEKYIHAALDRHRFNFKGVARANKLAPNRAQTILTRAANNSCTE